jgi:hypothetical protein
VIASVRITGNKQDGSRYFYNNDFFGAGDAIILTCILRHFRPKKVIEVGSGFSSAVTLDTIGDPGFQANTTCTFIEPNPERLYSLVSCSDRERTEVVPTGVQNVPLERFEELRENDVLFLDTTHVSKTGSDVNFELFEILPRLRSGVIVHFHDVFDNFEYPLHWISVQNRSWNELYLLRAFLMHNREFEIIFFNHRFIRRNIDQVRAVSQLMAEQPGGSLWLRKR